LEEKEVRPYKLTEEIEYIICAALGVGSTRTAAFTSAGISRRTFYDWMKGVPEFKEAVEDAEAAARVAIEVRLSDLALSGDRFALMYYLQNRYPDDWKDTRNFKIDQTLQLDDKRKAEATDDDIMDILEGEGVDCTQFRSEEYLESQRNPKTEED
jgi:hypothetical protein